MNAKGYCLYFHTIGHVVVIVSSANEDNNALYIPLSSIHFNKQSNFSFQGVPCAYYDPACTFIGDEIVSDNNTPVIDMPTYAAYQYAGEMPLGRLTEMMAAEVCKYRCKISNDVLIRLQEGAKKTTELISKYHRYFNLF